jgi:uncharacterized integral membrane protein (TIGR00698 family)
MNFIKKNFLGMGFCLIIALVAWFFGTKLPIIGGPVFGILLGMVLTLIIKDKSKLDAGIKFTSKKILQYAVILLGFGLNLNVIVQTGAQSLPIIVCTISTSLIVAYLFSRVFHIPAKISTLIGVGSSICGGSAIAATAPVIKADDDEVAQAISVIFFFNVLAALIFPHLGAALGFSHTSGNAFGVFAGTAVNDTSSVTAAAATWDNMWHLGSATLDKAVTVKLTRTLAIIPITLVLSFIQVRHAKKEEDAVSTFKFSKVFPFFILFFLLASLMTTVATSMGVNANVFNPVKELSKFFIIWAMAAIGMNTNIIKLIKTGGKPLFLGCSCWIAITVVSLSLQYMLHII